MEGVGGGGVLGWGAGAGTFGGRGKEFAHPPPLRVRLPLLDCHSRCSIPSYAQIWTAGGARANSGFLATSFGTALDPATGRVRVNQFGQVQGQNNVFALGDVAQLPVPEQALAYHAVEQAKVRPTHAHARTHTECIRIPCRESPHTHMHTEDTPSTFQWARAADVLHCVAVLLCCPCWFQWCFV